MWTAGKAIEGECRKLEEAIMAMFVSLGLPQTPEQQWLACDVRQQNVSCNALGFEWQFQQEGPYQDLWLCSPRYPSIIIPLREFGWIIQPPGLDVSEAELWQQSTQITTLVDAADALRRWLPIIVATMTEGQLPAIDRELVRLRKRRLGVK
jgi:hypothetical protein